MAYDDSELRPENALFLAGTPEATRHNRLKFLEGELLQAATLRVAKLRTVGGRDHLQRGIIRRHMMMQMCRIRIREHTIGRREPLDPYLATELGIYLNAYYLNLMGALDNFAWSLTYEHSLRPGINEEDRGARTFCVLDNSKFGTALTSVRPAIARVIGAALPWIQEVKRFRDPAAHRLPLTFVAAFLDEADAAAQRALHEQGRQAVERGDLNEYFARMHEANALGRFVPVVEAPRTPKGELYVAPNQVAADQELFVALSSAIIAGGYP